MSQRWFKFGLTGSVVTAICCFTPVLALLGVPAVLLGQLDTYLLPVLGIFAAITIIAHIKGKTT